MYLLYDKNKYKIIDLISYDTEKFIAQINIDNTPFNINETELIFELYTDDSKYLRTFKKSDYVNHNMYQLKDTNLYTIVFNNNIEISDEENNSELSLEVIRSKKIAQLSSELSLKIADGVYLLTKQGLKQFSFEEHDQRNIANICNYLHNNPDIEEYYYHANGELSVLYNKEDLLALYQVMLEHIAEWTEKYRQLREYINKSEDIVKILAIDLHTNLEDLIDISAITE